MAQTGYTPIQIYNTTVASRVPSASNLTVGELAINARDGILYYKNSATNTVGVLATASSGAANVLGGATGSLLYQTALNTTGFLSLGTDGFILTAGATAPEFTNPSTITIGKATNIAGGALGSVPYQTGSGTTNLLAIGTSGQVLTVSPLGYPYWATSPTATLANNLAGGTAGAVLYQSNFNTSGFTAVGTTGQLLTSNGTSAPSWVNSSSLTVSSATTATNIAAGSAGALPYQTASGTTTFLSLGVTNYVLTAGSGGPQYVAQSTLSVGAATTATNIAAGTTGALPYQSASGTTAFLGLGTTNYVLTAGSSGPQYVAQSTLSVGAATTATTATNIAGGGAGSIPYQSASGTTSFLGAGTAGYVLTSNGTSAPTWTAGSGVSLSGNNTWTGTQAFTGASTGVLGARIVNAADSSNIVASSFGSSVNLYVNSGAVLLYTGGPSAATFSINFSFTSTVTLNTAMVVGDALTVVFINKQTSTASYPTSFSIDGSSVVPLWSGQVAPTNGTLNATDIYTFTILKTASATFTVYANQTTYS